MADHLGITVKAFMARSEYGNIYGTRIYNKLVGEGAYKAIKIPGYRGKLYMRGAAFGVTGSTVTGAVNPGMYNFKKDQKPTLIHPGR